MEERKPYGVNKEMKKTLKTVEELTQALSEGKTVYVEEAKNYDHIAELKLINGIIVIKDKDNDVYIGASEIYFDENKFYLKEKPALKIEVNNFYKTRKGHKALCYFEDTDIEEKHYYFAVVGATYLFKTKKDGREIPTACVDSDFDIVDYWEDK